MVAGELVMVVVVVVVVVEDEEEECMSARVRVSAITQLDHVLPGLLMFPSDLDYNWADLASSRAPDNTLSHPVISSS